MINEMPLVGVKMLYQVEKKDVGFYFLINGLFVLLIGDFKQLSPVKDSPLYNNKCNVKMSIDGGITFEYLKRKFSSKNTTYQSWANQL